MMASSGWHQFDESTTLLKEMLIFTAGKVNPAAQGQHTYEGMSVRRLREELESFGLDLDGTREMLLHRLKDNAKADANGDDGDKEED